MSKKSLHLIIPASETNPNLCKAMYSAFILGYPHPSLINFGDTYDELGDGHQKELSHAAKIRGIFNFLNDMSRNHLKDHDLVLVVDGFDMFFQLPAELLITRFRTLVEQHNERWRRRYGTVGGDESVEGKTIKESPKFAEKIVFGADKICFPNLPIDPACAAVPSSTLLNNIYGDDTDINPDGFHNRAKYLNSGTIIGSIADVRAAFSRAVHKVDLDHRGSYGDQFVFAEIFGEQEYERSRSPDPSGWLHWLSNSLGTSDTHYFTSISKERIPTRGRNYEFGIGLDYESSLFQTMTHSWDDVDWLFFNNTDALENTQKLHGVLPSSSITLPPDILRLPSGPFPSTQPGADQSSPTSKSILDTMPQNLTWINVPLATNAYSKTVPAMLHFNGIGAKIHMRASWHQMWYQPYARDILHALQRSSNTEATTENNSSDAKEGRPGDAAGAWTGNGTWMSWLDLCHDFEDEVLGNGIGV